MASPLRDTFDARQVAGDNSTNNEPWHCQACLFSNKGDRNTCAACKRKRQKDDKPGYYHGNISRKEACTILDSKDSGSFLIRELTPNRMILCVKHQWGVTSCSLFVDANGQIFLGSKWNFESIESLVRYFSTNDGLLTKLTHPAIRKAPDRDLFPWEIKLSEIDVKYRIGSGGGRLGEIYDATYMRSKRRIFVRIPNVFYLKQVDDAIDEATKLVYIQHPNVVKFIGLCIEYSPMYVVTEFMPKGNLLNYVQNHQEDIHHNSMMSMARQIAAGLTYLEVQSIHHPNLSLRHCLISEDDTIKVGGYEMSKLMVTDKIMKILSSDLSMAPETRKSNILTSMSNVWGYGFVLWELTSLGRSLYPGINYNEMSVTLEKGYRMQKPQHCPMVLYTLMLKCWKWIPEDRPTFTDICKELEDANLTDEKVGNDISNIVKISNVPLQMTVQTLRLYVEGLSEDMKSSVGHIRFDDNNSTAFIDFISNAAAESFMLMGPTEIEGCQVKCERYITASQDDMSDVMSEIKNLGFETVQGFEEIMKKGSYKCYWNRVYLVGNYKIGKTTLAKVLVGDPVPEVRQSTDGIWLYIGLAGMEIDQQKWICLPKGSAIKTVISSMLMSLSCQEDQNPQIEEPFELPVQTGSIESNTENAVNTDTINVTPGTNDNLHEFFDREISQIEKESKLNTFSENLSHMQEGVLGNIIEAMSNEKIRELVVDVARVGRYKMKIVPIDIWDFGGQKDYYMTHQLFITSRGIFVLMFNGSQNMHQHMSDLSFLPGHYGQPTIAVYLKHWVNSILTFCRRVKECFPRILFVATHKDLIPKNEVEQQRQYLIRSIHKLFEHHSGYGHLEYKNLLFIDARDSSDKEITLLKQLLIQRAIDHPRWGEDMPTAWVPLELELLQEVENGNNIISRSQLEKLNDENKTFTLTPNQLEGFLKIQHSLGKLIYFDEMNLRNFIILNPVYLIEILRSIVTDQQFWQRGESCTESFQRLRNEGIIEKKTIYSKWEQDEFSHIHPFKEFMLDILIHLDIIVSPRTDLENLPLPFRTVSFYLVPCMITNPDNTNYIATYCNDNNSIVLAYTFVDDVIPPALSYRFLGSILTMWDVKINNGTRMMFCDLTVVEIDADHDVAVQVKDKRVVVSLVHRDNKKRIVPTLASSIQECLTAAIFRISEFYSSLSTDSITNKGLNTTMPFEIEFGVFCQSSMCYLHHRKMPSAIKVTWECQQHRTENDVRYLRYWYADKKHAESCSDTCSGPGKLEIEQYPSDQLLRRLVTELNINTCRELAISLGMKVHTWEDLEYQFQHDNIDNIKFMALWKWKQKHKTACIRDLVQGLKKCNTSIHYICQVFRDVCINCDFSENILDVEPTIQSLKAVSDYIGNSSLQLGVELGLDVPQIENIQNQLKNKPLEQTREILTRWRASDQFNPSVRSLIKALYRIYKAACVDYINF